MSYALSAFKWTEAAARAAENESSMLRVKGVYRCWQSNRGSRSQSCSGTPLIFSDGNRYELGEEKGTFTVTDDRITLSVSSRTGEVLDSGNAVLLESDDGDAPVTYLRQFAESVQRKN
jgi:hypothetical protein